MLLQNFIAIVALGLAGFSAAQTQNLGPSSGVACGRGKYCRSDQKCVPNKTSCKNLKKCKGTCYYKKTFPSCGGMRIQPVDCAKGSTCKDDPRALLAGSCGMACDAPGICIPNNTPSCGGIAGFKCPKGKYCYDTPNDSCDPENGGADCPSICL